MLLHYLGKLKIQIFCRYSVDMEENANCILSALNNAQWIPVSRNISRTVLWVCGLSCWLQAKSLTVSTFSSVWALRGLPLLCRMSTVPVSSNFLNSLLTLRLVQLFSGNSSVNLFAVYPFKYKLFFSKILSLSLNAMLIVDKQGSNVRCEEFLVPQIDRKNKQVKEQWHGKFCLPSVWGKTRYFKHRKYQNLWMNNKVRGD